MRKLQFKVSINAPVTKVYDIMLHGSSTAILKTLASMMYQK
jgi:hypothetical protein